MSVSLWWLSAEVEVVSIILCSFGHICQNKYKCNTPSDVAYWAHIIKEWEGLLQFRVSEHILIYFAYVIGLDGHLLTVQIL